MKINFNTKWRETRLHVPEATFKKIFYVEAIYSLSDVCMGDQYDDHVNHPLQGKTLQDRKRLPQVHLIGC